MSSPRAYTPINHDLEGLALSPAQPKALVLFLHGFGANGADLMGIGQALAPHLPEIGFVAPDAPGRLPFGPNSRFWFPLTPDLKPEDLDRGVQQARPLVADYIKAVLHDFDMPADKLLLVGFSQGCMIALETAPRLDTPVGQVMGLSGALAGEERLANEAISRPPIFLGHGTADPVVPFAAMDRAKNALESADFDVTSAAYEGVGHGIPNEAIQTLATFAQGL